MRVNAVNELPGLVDRDARLPGVASEDAGAPLAGALKAGVVSDGLSSREVKGKGPFQGTIPVLPGGSYE
jgi:hypothetical protein